MSGSRARPLAVGLVAMALAALVTALALSLAAGDDEGASDPSVLTLDPDTTGTVPQSDLAGEPAPDFAYEPLSGGPERTFDDLRDGRPALINFFAEWCVPCVQEMPDLEAAHQAYGDRVAFLGLSYNESAEDAVTLVERTGVTYETGRDPAGDILTSFAGLGMPTTVFVQADGTIATTHTGRITPDDLDAELEALLA